MINPTDTLAQMVSARYAPLTDRVVFYDEHAPEIDGIEQNVYAVVHVQGSQRGYIIRGGGRQVVDWTTRLLGTYNAVSDAVGRLPAALNRPYRNGQQGITVMHTHLQQAGGIGRITDLAQAAAVLRFTSEIVTTG